MATPHRVKDKKAGSPSRKTSTAMVVAAPPPKPWLLSQDEVAILKNAVCKGATDEELKFCLATARRYELDPFRKQIWFIKRWDSEALSSEGKRGAHVWTPQTSIDGLCFIGARDHRDYGSFSEPEYGPIMEVKYRRNGEGAEQKLNVPEWARIEAWKKGASQPTVAKVWWEEIYPDIDKAPLVRRMPRLMLAKCAKAQAIRSAYPAIGGLLIPEETEGREFKDFTPSGRVFSREEPKSEYLSKFEEREREQMKNLTQAQVEVVERKMEEIKKDPSVRVLSFPAKQDGDCEVAAEEVEAKALGLVRRATSEGVWLVRFARLTEFYDKAKSCGIEVVVGSKQ